MTVKSLLLAGLAAATMSSAALAESADRAKPIEVNAHNFQGDEIQQVAVYTGAVEVHQGTLEILGDVLTVKVSPDGYRTMTVTGNPVKIKERRDPNTRGVEEWMHASALNAVYDERHDTIILTNNAKVARSENGLVKDSAAGAKITYDLLTARSRVEGEKVNGKRTRVTTVLAPRGQTPQQTQKAAPRKASPAPMRGSTRLGAQRD